LTDAVQKAALEALTTFCGKHPDEIAGTAAKVIRYLSDTLYLVSNVKLFFQLRAHLIIALILSP
jgi:hypothetical protein